MIDRGQVAVAAAEDRAFGGTSFNTSIRRAAVERLLDGVVGGEWWRLCGRPVVVSTPRPSTRSSSARRAGDCVEIRVSDEQLSAATAAHELAHALAGIAHGHDEVFRAAHVDMCTLLGGSSAAHSLSEAYGSIGLAVATRRWPQPFRALGDGFVMTAVSDTTFGHGAGTPGDSSATVTATATRRSR